MVGFVFACVGFLVVAIFWPLLYPLSLNGSTHGEDAVGAVMAIAFLLFGAGGFLLCRWLTRGVVRQDNRETLAP